MQIEFKRACSALLYSYSICHTAHPTAHIASRQHGKEQDYWMWTDGVLIKNTMLH